MIKVPFILIHLGTRIFKCQQRQLESENNAPDLKQQTERQDMDQLCDSLTERRDSLFDDRTKLIYTVSINSIFPELNEQTESERPHAKYIFLRFFPLLYWMSVDVIISFHCQDKIVWGWKRHWLRREPPVRKVTRPLPPVPSLCMLWFSPDCCFVQSLMRVFLRKFVLRSVTSSEAIFKEAFLLSDPFDRLFHLLLLPLESNIVTPG